MTRKESKEALKLIKKDRNISLIIVAILILSIICGCFLIIEVICSNLDNKKTQIAIMFGLFIIISAVVWIYNIKANIDNGMLYAFKNGDYKVEKMEILEFMWGVTEKYPDGHLYCRLTGTEDTDVNYIPTLMTGYKLEEKRDCYLFTFSDDVKVAFCPKKIGDK